MRAQPGDRLVLEGVHAGVPRRVGIVTEVRGIAGAPPYLVRWLDNDHVTLVYPGPEARVESPRAKSRT
jgi:hypothetical protein